MADLFTPMPRELRQGFSQFFLDNQRLRNGVPDAATRTFSLREQVFRELKSNPIVRPDRPVDAAVFARNEVCRNPEAGLDQRTLWALCCAKANRGEAYGVNWQFAQGQFDGCGPDDPFFAIAIEEDYHTRVLRDAVGVLGLSMQDVPPERSFRFLIKALIAVPRPLRYVMILCAEVAAVAMFRLLLDKARELFADHPPSLARIEVLLSQILIDEVGHAHFLRSKLGPWRLALAKRLLPFIARGLLDSSGEACALFGRDFLYAKMMEADVDGAAAEFPQRLRLPETDGYFTRTQRAPASLSG